MKGKYKHTEITRQIIKAFYTVYNTLGYGFLEKVYENAMVIELFALGLEVESQSSVEVYYHEQLVGKYFTDLLVEGCVIVELKAARELCAAHEAQLLNYLKATPHEVGLLLNFGSKPKVKRKAYDNISLQKFSDRAKFICVNCNRNQDRFSDKDKDILYQFIGFFCVLRSSSG